MNRLIAISIVRNEENNYLGSWLENMKNFVDYHILLDDASDDNTPGIIKEFLDNGYRGELHERQTSIFKENEPKLRSELWEYTRKIAKDGDWILIVDADEFYDEEMLELKSKIFKTDKNTELYYLQLLDMWTEKSFRVDGYWSPCLVAFRLFRYKNLGFVDTDAKLHMRPCPEYVLNLKGEYSSVPMIHKGYIKDEKKKFKYEFYKKNVVNNKDMYKHALSILEEPAVLMPYKEFRKNDWQKVMVSSLVHNRDWLLDIFLQELGNLDYPKDKITFYFITNNITDNSLNILKSWQKQMEENGYSVIIEEYNFTFDNQKNRKDHEWNRGLVLEMANMRNMQLAKAKELGSEFMLNVDSDLLAPSCILKHLIKLNKKIISPIFYAGWKKNKRYLPQVWSRGCYEIDNDLVNNLMLRDNTFRVGGLGAFTLIHRSVWEAGVNYTRVYNLPEKMFGEDRDFCTRASVMGFELYGNNSYPILHVDNEKILQNYKDSKLIVWEENKYSVIYQKYKIKKKYLRKLRKKPKWYKRIAIFLKMLVGRRWVYCIGFMNKW